MYIDLSAQGISLDDDLRDHISRRTHFALGRFGERVSRVRIRLVDVNGPRGGVDTRCLVQVHLPRTAPILVESLALDVETAVDTAMERVGRTVARRIERARDRRRGRDLAA